MAYLFFRGEMADYKLEEVGDQEPIHYPNLAWARQSNRYRDYWHYYDGEKLDEEVEAGITETGAQLLRFPLRINLIKMAVMKHAFALLGEYTEQGIVEFRGKARRRIRPEIIEPGQKAETDPLLADIDQFLEDLWDENGAMSILPEQARIAHVCGGCVFKVAYDETKETKVRIEVILPDYFFPVWDSTDYHNLLEVTIAYDVPVQEAKLRLGYVPTATAGSGDTALYQEHWTKTHYECTIGGQPAKSPHGLPYSGPNPYVDPATGEGILPFEYFPVDRAGEFYGHSLVADLMGLQDEFNIRLGDVGDAVNEAVHPLRYGRNLPRQRKDIKLSRYKIINLGQNAPGQEQPEVGYVEHPGLPQGTMDFLKMVMAVFQQVAHTPPVAYGMDEGSQRSALTLAFRMWPTTAYVRDTRALWSAGFAQLNRKAMIIHMTKAGKTAILRKEHLGYTLTTKWSPIIPRDREQLVNETILLSSAKLRSPEMALAVLGDVEDIPGEIERIKSWQETLLTLQPAGPFGPDQFSPRQELMEPKASVLVE